MRKPVTDVYLSEVKAAVAEVNKLIQEGQREYGLRFEIRDCGGRSGVPSPHLNLVASQPVLDVDK